MILYENRSYMNGLLLLMILGAKMDIHAEQKTSVAIIGAGQVGCYLTALCSNNTSYEVHVLARSNYAALQESGVTLTKKEGTSISTTQFCVYDDIRTMPACDIVIIATGVHQNEALRLKDSHLFHKKSCVITMQNGLDFENKLIEQLPFDLPLYSGTSWIKVARISPTEYSHQFGAVIKLGCYNKIDDFDERVKIFFNDIGLIVDTVSDIQAVQITKLVLNIPFLLYMAKYGTFFNEILSDEDLNSQRLAIQNEIIAVAEQMNIAIDMEHVNSALLDMISVPNPVVSSREQFSIVMRPKVLSVIEPFIHYVHRRGKSLPLLEKEFNILQNCLCMLHSV